MENFWDILPVEPMNTDNLVAGINEEDGFFDIAEEKAIKAIQKHSMQIDGWERNPQIDEAYMLLGKARYFDRRFVPALEAFNFVLQRYPLSNSINQAKIWREKTRLRLNQESVVISSLKEILEVESLTDQERADAAATLAQAYMNLTFIDSALVHIRNAADLSSDKAQKSRYFFIAGQLYNASGESGMANMAFSEIINFNRQIPREFLIHAQLFQLRNLGVDQENRDVVLDQLREMTLNRENRPYLGRIFFEKAAYFHDLDSIAPALRFYKRSLYEGSLDVTLRWLTYRNIGNIYLNEGYYLEAGAYYDSTLTYLAENTREHRNVLRQRTNLDDVIYYENVLKTNDSILYLSSLSEEAQLEFFTRYTEELKAKAAETEFSSTPGGPERAQGMGNQPQAIPQGSSTFYFYNPDAVARGREEFRQIWGTRPLADNWRSGASTDLLEGAVADRTQVEVESTGNLQFDPEVYLARLPKDPATLDSLQMEVNSAHYQLGLIYRDKFDQLEKAAMHLEQLLESEPEERLVVPAKFNLLRVYEMMEADVQAISLRNEILSQHPNSRYALILEHPEIAREELVSTEEVFSSLQEKFQQQEFEEVIRGVEDYTQKNYGESSVPAFRMLRAKALGRLLGLEAYSSALNEVALDYPQTQEGRRAALLLNETIPKLSEETLQPETPEESYKILFRFDRDEVDEAELLKEELDSIFKQRGLQYETSIDIYNPEELFVVVHGFERESTVHSFWNVFPNLKENLNLKNYLYISGRNYRIVQMQKNLATYLIKYPPE